MDGVRVEYEGEGLSEAQLAPTPWRQAIAWVEQAQVRQADSGDVPEPLAMSVATVDDQGRPDVRTVLMRFFDPSGPGFVTNTSSAKGVHLAGNPAIAASLTWPAMFRAVRFHGLAQPLTRAEVTAYFQQRPWGARIGAWASLQSRPVASRVEMEEAYQRYAARWPDRGRPDDVPVPDHWGGYRVVCDRVEFWGGRRNRLHDRLVFSRVAQGSLDEPSAWRLQRLQP